MTKMAFEDIPIQMIGAVWSAAARRRQDAFMFPPDECEWVELADQCMYCGGALKLRLSWWTLDELQWYWNASATCPECGQVAEWGGCDQLGSYLAGKLEAVCGTWAVCLVAMGRERLKVVSALRSELSISLQEALELGRREPTLVYTGPIFNAQRLAGILSRLGASVLVEPKQPIAR